MRFDAAAHPSKRLTGEIAGVGGRLRDRPEDFRVDEEPLYRPSGEGEHVYLRIEKRGESTSRAIDRLARALGVRRRAIAFAGLKDRHAVTTQWISVHDPGSRVRVDPGEVRPGLRILEMGRHTNKLRKGHLAANRFTITIRDVAGDPACAREALERLAREGVPNRAGQQRFGMRQNNHLVGRLDLLGDYEAMLAELLGPETERQRDDDQARRLYAAGRFAEARDAHPRSARAERAALGMLAAGHGPREACRAIERDQRAFWLSALQSAIFNHVLDDRLERGALASVEPGDVVMLFAEGRKGPLFVASADDATDADTRARAEQLEITATGPLWGPQMARAAQVVADREREALAVFGLDEATLAAFAEREGSGLMPGARRPLRALLREPDVDAGADAHGPFLRCRFTLSPGAFATTVMDEVMKPDIA